MKVNYTGKDNRGFPLIWFLLTLLAPLATKSDQLGDFVYLETNSAITIVSYTGQAKAVSIPSAINGLPVVCLEYESFYYRSNLVSITIPETVTNIVPPAIYGCDKLTNITVNPTNPNFSSSNGVLYDKEQTVLIRCPEGKRGTYSIPDSVTNVISLALDYCALSSITVGKNISDLSGQRFIVTPSSPPLPPVLPSVPTNSLPRPRRTPTAPATPDSGFVYGITVTELQPVNLSPSPQPAPSTATTPSVAIPPNIIPNYLPAHDMLQPSTKEASSVFLAGPIGWPSITVFGHCLKLTNITVDPLNPAYSSTNGILLDKSGSLLTCPRGRAGHLEIPPCVTNIGDYAFSDCDQLETINLPDTINNIGNEAFLSCTKLKKIAIPSSVTNIGTLAFSSCSSLSEFTVSPSNSNYSASSGVLFDKTQQLLILAPNGKQGIYSVPASVTAIANDAFNSCGGLTQINLSTAVTNIGSGAFAGCTNLAHITLPEEVVSIGSEAFGFCLKLTRLTIPASVQNIGDICFSSCSRLTNIIVDPLNQVYCSIDGSLFDKSQAVLLQCPEGKRGSYTIPNSATSIAARAFFACSGLTNITIPNSITSIDQFAFTGCSGLTNIIIPASVTNIGVDAFYCRNLKSVCFEGDAPACGDSYGSYIFSGMSTVYYWPENSGWGTNFAGATTAIWQSAPITIITNGMGTVTSICDRQVLGIGSTNTITAHPAKDYLFAGWSSNLLPPQTNATLRFVMQPNLQLSAHFTPINPPVIKIIFPTMDQRITNQLVEPSWGDAIWVSGATFEKRGTITNVMVQLNDAEWAPAMGHFGTNWNTMAQPALGTNVLRAYAIDAAGNLSATDSVTFVVLPPVLLPTDIFHLNVIGSGSVSPNYDNDSLEIGRTFSITATPDKGWLFSKWTDGNGRVLTNGPTVQFTMQPQLSLTATFIENPVSVAIIFPTNYQRFVYSSAMPAWGEAIWALGTASSTVGAITNVMVQLNGTGTPYSAFSVGNQWTTHFYPAPGVNYLKVYAVDDSGNRSEPVYVSFMYVKSAELHLATTGLGSISPNYSNASLHLGNTYTITATPAKGYLFSNWTTSSGYPLTNSPTLRFTMDYNLSFVANFAPNRFTNAHGIYSGLFTNLDGAGLSGAGSFSAKVDPSGILTATLRQGGKFYSISSRFSPDGSFSAQLANKTNLLTLSLQLDLSGAEQIKGQVQGADWTASLLAFRDAYSRTNPPPQAHRPYTLAIAPGDVAAAEPGGCGFGTISVDVNGNVTFTGLLGDGTAVSPSTTLSSHGDWPFYVSLYSGNGAIVGWLKFTNAPDADVTGTLSWTKSPQPKDKMYKSGFTNQVEVAGSEFIDKSGQRALSLTNGLLILGNDNLSAGSINQVVLKANNIASGTGASFSINKSSGLFSGTVIPIKGPAIGIKGAVLQKQDIGYGQFTRSNRTEQVMFKAN